MVGLVRGCELAFPVAHQKLYIKKGDLRLKSDFYRAQGWISPRVKTSLVSRTRYVLGRVTSPNLGLAVRVFISPKTSPKLGLVLTLFEIDPRITCCIQGFGNFLH